MQRPRLTERTAKALSTAFSLIEADYEEIMAFDEGGFDKASRDDLKRALIYLEDLLRWHRCRVTRPDNGPTQSPALGIVPAHQAKVEP
jgi:hypothetical protein